MLTAKEASLTQPKFCFGHLTFFYEKKSKKKLLQLSWGKSGGTSINRLKTK